MVEDIASVRAERARYPTDSWGLVPTMGYLHEGHMSLVRRARSENQHVAVSIFVNPAQFSNPGDLDQYPRDEARDLAMLEDAGTNLVWTPHPDTVYPEGYATYVDIGRITERLEGASRPGHFRGVATVVSKLFNVFEPTRAYFGQKDAQQAATMQRMVRDLNFNLDLVICPTIRADDGLALSSRNARLTDEERILAPRIYDAMMAAQRALHAGTVNGGALRALVIEFISKRPEFRVDYVSIADTATLRELETVDDRALLSVAVFLGDVRLIDNITLDRH
ncbi:MAG: pantoate--beta-alanine ligase [Pseudomonadota bacterium]